MDQVEIESAIRKWGRAALSFDTLLRPECYSHFISKKVPGALVSYQRFGACEVVMGDVVAPEEGRLQVAQEYFKDRLGKKQAVLGFSWPLDLAESAVTVGAAAAQWTAEPQLDPVHYKPSGKHAKKLRSYVRKLRNHGVEGKEMIATTDSAPGFRAGVEALVTDWLRHGPPRGSHLLEVDPWIQAHEKRFFGVFDPEDESRLWSLLIAHPIPGRAGWHLCHLMHDHQAPRGVNELAVLTAVETFAEEGCEYATFGPFASPEAGPFLGFGNLLKPVLRRIYNTVAKQGGYTHTLEFYEKVQAHPWADRYMVMTSRHFPMRPLRALLDLTHALGTHGRHPTVGHTPTGALDATSR